MPRPLRIDDTGGMYHILNRGNYQQWVFRSEGAKEAFERTLFEACDRAGWELHGFCIMSNHYHLAISTPKGNLSEGMRWLQSVFANRFNRYRRESGHLFQGRFKSLAVENSERLGWLCHYLHLNPVRAKLCSMEELANYRWSSYWYLRNRKKRPSVLTLEDCLASAGGLKDNSTGWRRYAQYLNWLQEEQPARKKMEFARMSKGWAIGDQKFRKSVVAEDRELRQRVQLDYKEVKEARELQWEAALERCLKVLKFDLAAPSTALKSADWKVGIATFMKARYMTGNAWLAEKLSMGNLTGVSRYASETQSGQRPQAAKYLKTLTARVKH